MAVEIPVISDPVFAVHGTIRPEFDGFVDLHIHPDGDTADSPEEIIEAVAYSGLTGFAATNHDSTRELERYQEIITSSNYNIELIPGVESTTLMPDHKGRYHRKHPRHALAYFDPLLLEQGKIPDVPCYMPAREFNIFIHEHGGKTSVAHPAMGGFSFRLRQIREIQADSDPNAHFDYVEGHHGGVVNLIRFKQQNPILAESIHAVGLLPHVIDTNRITRTFVQQRGRSLDLKGMTAGSDAHDKLHPGIAGVMYQRSKGLFPSIDCGDYALVQTFYIAPPWNIRGVLKGTVGGWRMEIERWRRTDGFVIYDRNAGKN